jgi:methylenetetrahydrofolate dehydrogenase (NADP+)/methenyltetrahydrofolate cyclohydrolase
MDTKLFDGKALARKIETELKQKSIHAKLVSILIGDNSSSELFLSLKQKSAERVGATLEIKKFEVDVPQEEIIHFIELLNSDNSVKGIMVQLPIPTGLSREQIIDSITPSKDVDGMRADSHFTAPVVLAVWAAIMDSGSRTKEAVVVGANGFVGKKLTGFLEGKGYMVSGLDVGSPDFSEKVKQANLLISTTGSVGLIKGSMINNGVVLVDVGSPKGDIERASVQRVASFLSPVPGGVGPLMIAYLMANLVQ